MKIKFLLGYSGRETAMKEYGLDAIAEISNAQAMELIRLGVAEEVEEVEAIEVTTYSDPQPVFIESAKKPRKKAR